MSFAPQNARACLALVLIAGFATVTACGPSLYDLPSPEKVESAVARAEAEAAAAPPPEDMRFGQARAAMLNLHHLLVSKRFSEAEELLSVETREFLAQNSQQGRVDQALASGKLTLPSGQDFVFEAAGFLLADDVSGIVDELEGSESIGESATRKILYAVQPSGEARQIVVIKEGDQWVLHRTSIH
ncbi:MAG: hypothetical protein H0U74_02495 [Bradymonadaceae bacterium]|nr:hypothetical protein [Lujinxingiaceae bacterium]